MRIVVIGASGNVGRLAMQGLKSKHEIVTVGRTTGDIRADIASASGINEIFDRVANIDAVICAAGDSDTRSLQDLDLPHIDVGIMQKLKPQIDLVLNGMKRVNNNGSFTLVSGKMGDHPAVGSIGKSIVNAAINNFVVAAANELERGIRINAVSPAKLGAVPDGSIAEAFRRSVESDDTGVIYRIY